MSDLPADLKAEKRELRIQAHIEQSRAVLQRIDADWPTCCFMPPELQTIRRDTADYLRSLHRDMVGLRAARRKHRPPDPVMDFRDYGYIPAFRPGEFPDASVSKRGRR